MVHERAVHELEMYLWMHNVLQSRTLATLLMQSTYHPMAVRQASLPVITKQLTCGAAITRVSLCQGSPIAVQPGIHVSVAGVELWSWKYDGLGQLS